MRQDSAKLVVVARRRGPRPAPAFIPRSAASPSATCSTSGCTTTGTTSARSTRTSRRSCGLTWATPSASPSRDGGTRARRCGARSMTLAVHRRARAPPAHRPRVRGKGSRPLRRRVGGGRADPAVVLAPPRRARPPRPRVPRRARGRRRRLLLERGAGRGDGALPLGRRRLQRAGPHRHVVAVARALRHRARRRRRYLPGIVAGETVCALAITEPDTGSDMAAVSTRAVRQGDVYHLTGRKIFITNGVHGDLYFVAARTGRRHAGAAPRRALDVPGRARPARLHREPRARQDGHARVGHRGAVAGGLSRAGGESPRRRGTRVPAARRRAPARAHHGRRARPVRRGAGAR